MRRKRNGGQSETEFRDGELLPPTNGSDSTPPKTRPEPRKPSPTCYSPLPLHTLRVLLTSGQLSTGLNAAECHWCCSNNLFIIVKNWCLKPSPACFSQSRHTWRRHRRSRETKSSFLTSVDNSQLVSNAPQSLIDAATTTYYDPSMRSTFCHNVGAKCNCLMKLLLNLYSGFWKLR